MMANAGLRVEPTEAGSKAIACSQRGNLHLCEQLTRCRGDRRRSKTALAPTFPQIIKHLSENVE
jgi:hypothetical protein